MTDIKWLDYPYTTTLKCDKCGKEFTVDYLDDKIVVKPVPACECNSSHTIISGMSYSEWYERRKKDWQERAEVLPDIINSILDTSLLVEKKEEGLYEITIYADYRDEIGDESVKTILLSSDPKDYFYDTIREFYIDVESDYLNDLNKYVLCKIRESNPEYEALFPDLEDWVYDYLVDTVYCELPYDHYLKQEFEVPIFIDTGDANYDYVLNTVYPSYDGDADEPINDKASLVWLAKQQGYTKEQLWDALLQGDISNPSGFLETVRQEVINEVSHMNKLTLLLKMSLKELMELNDLIKRHRTKYEYDADKRPDCGKIIIDKNVTCGLYDTWNGGGSCFGIELEKNLELPINLIAHEVLPESAKENGYGLNSCYGFCGSAWESGAIIDVIKPEEAPVA